MFPMNRKALNEMPVTLEYLSRGKLVRKEFPNSYAARQAFSRLDREGREPKVVLQTDRDTIRSPDGMPVGIDSLHEGHYLSRTR